MTGSIAWSSPPSFHVLEHHIALPSHCDPTTPFLQWFSASFHVCTPTPLAFLSSLFGILSICSWLFAQLPQIYKNWKLRSTAGLSFFFLTEWLLGDLSNLIGGLFTGQATWQVVLATYYVFVDVCLCLQWVWYTGLDTSPPQNGQKYHYGTTSGGIFRSPKYTTSPLRSASDEDSTSPESNARKIARYGTGTSPMLSPRTVLYTALILSLVTHGSATPYPYHAIRALATRDSGDIVRPSTTGDQSSPTQIIGTVVSWMSTFLYLGSRLPQLLHNFRRRSTAGLSLSLFAAAFCGNLFYSLSMLANPCAWNDFDAPSAPGWVGKDGSNRIDWVTRALPFFLGAAGVLVMDGAVGLQFWWYSTHRQTARSGRHKGEIPVPCDEERQSSGRAKWHWRRVSGWMRGWIPSVSLPGSVTASPRYGSPLSSSPYGTSGVSVRVDDPDEIAPASQGIGVRVAEWEAEQRMMAEQEGEERRRLLERDEGRQTDEGDERRSGYGAV
ncbi:hypothetical protein P152DRAFT_444078 [Eremomyces bilateralis CBS 781.70]|uniref:PQ-loop-domain-containing protein n=1 Tax=Eremomyces bilateralis CBS 781.70 TaxID=1392243 RepID=A0A6G1FRG9_9PEZI|nr:uncharacterized protein P152DRAFT_444078 [Eremomyces bilateralis CBS 781.70]KAF1808281.1 hypothetical protein P152DRAFT_444078 [Eremomyces bilateralis CBS 781.70]